MQQPEAADKKVVLNVVETDGKLRVLPSDFYRRAQQFGGGAAAQKITDKTIPPAPAFDGMGVEWAYWGDNDRLPTDMARKVSEVPIAGATLARKIAMLLGDEVVYFKNADLRTGGNQAERAYLPEVENFLAVNRIQEEWYPAQCGDYSLYLASFSELIKSRDGKKITNLYHLNAEATRLSRIDKNDGRIKYLLHSYEWEYYGLPTKPRRVMIPLFRWYESDFHQWLRGAKFAWYTRFPTPGLIYYPRPWWAGLFKENGWLDVSAQVPKIVSAMQRNQIALKYLILVPESYYEMRHLDWASLDEDKRNAIIDKHTDEIESYLTGVDNAGKTLLSLFKQGINGEAMGKVEIVPVDDKTKTGTWVPDSAAADAQIVQGFGMHPSQIGLSPEGGKMGAGSGSDQRETYNLGITLNTPDQRLLLEPLNYISQFNGWGVTFAIAHTHHTTTNNQESGLMPNNRTTQVRPPKST